MSLSKGLANSVDALLKEFVVVSKLNKNFHVRLVGLLKVSRERNIDITGDLLQLSKEVMESTSRFSTNISNISKNLALTLVEATAEHGK